MSKRMFSDDIVESDAFLDMPLTAQALYMHLNMNADNDGFVNPKRILRMVGANDDDLRILIAKRFVLVFSSGVIVIKHWWINNTKRADRHVPTNYQNELAELIVKNNKSYTEKAPELALETGVGNQLATKRQPLVASMQFNAVHVQVKSKQGNTHTAAAAASAPKKSVQEVDLITKLYYEAVNALGLPVINHDTLHKKIAAMKVEAPEEELVNYLTFMRDQFAAVDIAYKPQISSAIDIYAKRVSVINAFKRAIKDKHTKASARVR